jgi:HK97 family phage major capsid protein
MNEYINRQVEIRNRAWEEAKSILDAASSEKRDLTAEETQTYERISKDLDERGQVIAKLREDEARELRLDAVTREISEQARPVAGVAVADDIANVRSLVTGERRSFTFEKRDVVKTSQGSPVPTSFYDQVIEQARLVGPMLATSTVLNTAGGENLQIPSQAAWSTAAVVGEGTAIDESDPIFNSFITLGAYKYSFLVQVSTELLEDSGVDLLGFLANQVGNELGFRVNSGLTVGSGTGAPKGVVAAAGSGILGGTGVAGAFTADNLIDLYYSLNGAARMLPGVGWMMNGASIGKVRKLKDTAGQYVFQPALSADAPDTLLGKPIFENPAVVDTAVGAKSVIVGHLPSYFVRSVGGIRLDRSDDYAFNAGLVTFRATFRVDGNLPQPSHIKYFIGGTA